MYDYRIGDVNQRSALISERVFRVVGASSANREPGSLYQADLMTPRRDVGIIKEQWDDTRFALRRSNARLISQRAR